MLDENLPTFFLKASPDSIDHHSTLYLTQYGSEPRPEYSLRRSDPSLSASRNNYAIAIFDSYNPEVLFAEILVAAEWTQPTLSAEEVRRNGGVPPPPQPKVPTEFTIQLYNPDQQVVVRQRPGSWGGSAYWEFEMPQQTFRQPSKSSLDRSQSDPAAAETTPKIDFKWKKEGKFSKDLICSLSGKSANSDGSKRKNREPDIAVALFKSLKEITVYEPNLYRVEVEDAKGFEVVLLLGATAIRDIYFGQIKQVFNIAERNRSDSGVSLGKGKNAASPITPQNPHATGPFSPPPSRQQYPPSASQPSMPILNAQLVPNIHQPRPPQQHSQPQAQPKAREPAPPPADPRVQWEIDAETARLKKAVEEETKSERRQRERVEQAEAKRVRKMVEAEQREIKRRQAIVQKESEQLQKLYGAEQQQVIRQQQLQQTGKPQQPQSPPRPQRSSQSYSAPLVQRPFTSPQSEPHQRGTSLWPHSPHSSQPTTLIQQTQPSGPYIQPPAIPNLLAQSSESSFLKPGDGKKMKARRSIFGLRSQDHGDSTKLSKKKSSMF
ncbi:MAG: hypothetical protein M1812_007694 [Candelaria pacifica]|nr:MAG: hypothetical protein M1812_007694 [Candelaria pacifica]